jgi:dihydroflavonol-4-reductase
MPSSVLLTGITGFIARRIAFDLLAAGHRVTGTLRSLGRADGVRDSLRANGLDDRTLERLRFVEADLTSDAGWGAAMAGIDAVIHTASPFPLAQPKNEDDLIRPAVDGTLRVLRAAHAAGIRRVILTSSIEAIMHGATADVVTEADWSDPAAPTASAYTRSKVLAERAAWDFVASHPDLHLTAINPGAVFGRPMDRETGSSVSIVARILSGKDPAVPDIRLPVTDIADVSAAHVAALDRPESIGQRYLVADRFMSMPDMARLIKTAYPRRRIATRIAPRWLLGILALFDAEVRMVLPWLDWHKSLDHRKLRTELGITPTRAEDSVLATARFLTGD